MLTLANLRQTRKTLTLYRRHLSAITGIDEARIRIIDRGESEPWYDEALILSRAMCTDGILPLITSGSLTLSTLDLDPLSKNDLRAWRAGVRATLSQACRLALHYGLTDPADLQPSAMARQIWEVLETSERLPSTDEYGVVYICPWCAVDRYPTDAGQAPHLPTCLPNNLWAAPTGEDVANRPRPATPRTRGKSMPGRGLRALREQKGATQREVATTIGLNPNYYTRIERCEVPLQPATAERLAGYYDVDKVVLYALPADKQE